MTDLPAGVSDDDVMRVANAIMMTFAKKWFLGSYKGPVYFDCINGEMAWLDEARAALTAALAGRVVVPREPTREMILQGLRGLVLCIEEMGGLLPPIKDGEMLSDSDAAQRYMQIGSLMRCGREVESCWRAMIAAAIDGDA